MSLVPSVEDYLRPIVDELRLDVFQQRLKMAERLINFPPEKMPVLHLEEWYFNYWRLLGMFQYVNDPPEQKEPPARQLLSMVSSVQDSIRRQYFALALLLFGKVRESQSLMNQDFWSKDLREDFATYSAWNRILTGAPNPVEQAMIKRNKVVNDFLRQKYSALIEKYANTKFDETTCPKIEPEDYKIFYCWLQGKESLPPLARCCYNSLKENAGNREVVFIDEKNFSDYVELPEHIMKKFCTGGGITRTHFSDILRVNLLERYGGLWLDATILVTEPFDNHKEFWELPYFTQTYTHEKGKYNGSRACASYSRWASFIQGTNILHNPLVTFEKDFYNEYWKDFNEAIDYLFF